LPDLIRNSAGRNNLLPPEIRIILYVGFIATLFLIQDLTIYLIILSISVILLAGMPRKSLKGGWVPITLLILFTFVSNILFQSGKILYQTGPFTITEEGINIASIRTMRLFLMIAGSKILTATTPVASLAGASERILKPLERLGVPVAEFFSIAGLAMKSIPRLKDHVASAYKQKVQEDCIQGFWGRLRIVSSFLLPLMSKALLSPEVFFKDDGRTD